MKTSAAEQLLRRAAEEIRAEGHAGWGNTCEDGADRIKELEAENQRLRRENELLQGSLNSLTHRVDPLLFVGGEE